MIIILEAQQKIRIFENHWQREIKIISAFGSMCIRFFKLIFCKTFLHLKAFVKHNYKKNTYDLILWRYDVTMCVLACVSLWISLKIHIILNDSWNICITHSQIQQQTHHTLRRRQRRGLIEVSKLHAKNAYTHPNICVSYTPYSL